MTNVGMPDAMDYHTVAAISHHNSTDDETCPVRCKENDDFGYLLRLGCASNRSVFAMLTEELAPVRSNIIQNPSYDISRANRIDTNTMSDIFNGSRPSQLRDSPFGGSIGCNLGKCIVAGIRAYVND